MTEQKHLKALIRARMARTGESYTAARSHIVPRVAAPSATLTAEFRGHDKHCMTAVFTPGDRHVISGGFGGQARIWELDGTPAGELVGHEAAVTVVRIAPDGQTVVTAASDKTVRVWDLDSRAERMILGKHRKQVLALDVAADGDGVWTGSHDGRLQLWRLSTGELETAVDVGGSVASLVVRRSDGTIAASVVGRGVVILDATGTEVTTIGEGSALGSVAWAADGSFLVASTRSGSAVWAADAFEPVRTLETGSGSLLPVALSPDGSRIAVGWDNHVGIWSADESEPPLTMDGLPKGVYGLSFSSDGRRLAGAAADGRVRIWSVT